MMAEVLEIFEDVFIIGVASGVFVLLVLMALMPANKDHQ